MVYTGYHLLDQGFSSAVQQCVAYEYCVSVLLFVIFVESRNQIFRQLLQIKLSFLKHIIHLVHPQIHKRNFHAIDQKMFSDPRKRFTKNISIYNHKHVQRIPENNMLCISNQTYNCYISCFSLTA